MLGRLIPRDERFFDLFNELATHLTSTAKMLSALFAEPHKVREHVKAIKDVEHAADLLTHTINQRIDQSFITPFDREDIHALATRLDDVIDLLDGTARRFSMLRLTEVRQPAVQLADVLVRAADKIQQAVAALETKSPTIIHQHTAVIKHLEEEGDTIYHEAVGALFDDKEEPLEVIKWKEMYDTLERATDSCMGVALVVQSIAFKNA